MRAFQISVQHTRTVALPFWLECLSQFHSSRVTTLQTQVSFVSIDHRGSPSVPSDWVGWSFSAGFTPLEMPFPDACRLPLASRSKCCSLSNSSRDCRRTGPALSRPTSGRFLVLRQFRETFTSPSETESKCFCELCWLLSVSVLTKRKLGSISQAVPGISLGKGRSKEQEVDRNGERFERMLHVASAGV